MLSRREFIKSGVAGLVAMLLPKPITSFVEKHLPVKLVNVFNPIPANNEIDRFLRGFPDCQMKIYVIDRDCGEFPTPDENGGLEWK